MKKTIIAFFAVTLLVTPCTFSQINLAKGFFSNDQQFIKEATDSVLFIVQSDYVLRDSALKHETTYGRNNKSYFGRVYGLAVLANNRLWIDSRIITPWVIDAEYKAISKPDSLVPVLSIISIRNVREKKFNVCEKALIYSEINTNGNYSNRGLAVINSGLSQKGLGIVSESTDSAGWFVIVYTQHPIVKNDSSEISVAIYREKVVLDKGSMQSIIKTPALQNIIGGVYLSTYASIGNVAFKLSGILIKKPLSWFLTSLPNEVKKEETETIIITPIPEKDDIIEARKPESKRKKRN